MTDQERKIERQISDPADFVQFSPVLLRARMVKSGWPPFVHYPHYFVTIPPKLVELLGWKGGVRVVPMADTDGNRVVLVRADPEPPFGKGGKSSQSNKG